MHLDQGGQHDQYDVLLMDKAIGTIGAIAFCGVLGWWLKGLSEEWPLGQFMLLCGAICAGFLALAHLLDRRDAARKAGRRYD